MRMWRQTLRGLGHVRRTHAAHGARGRGPADTSPTPPHAFLPSRKLTCSLRQDLYQQPIQRLVDFVELAYQVHPSINFEVFVHKADVLSEEYKTGQPAASPRAAVRPFERC